MPRQLWVPDGTARVAPIEPLAFSMLDLPDLVALYDSSDSGSITDAGGGAVSAWADPISGYDITQGTGGSRPTWGTRTLNGLPGVDFDGGDSLVNLAFANFPDGFTAFTVLTFDAFGGLPYDVRRGSDGNPLFQLPSGGDQIGFQLRNDAGTLVDSEHTGKSAPSTWIHVGTWDPNVASSNVRAYLNNGDATVPETLAGPITTDKITVGASFNGVIWEMAFCSSPLSERYRLIGRNVLRAKWAVY